MVKAWFNEIIFITGGTLTPAPAIYTEFELGTDEKTLLLKMGIDEDGGRVRVTNLRNPSQYLALATLEKKVGVDFIRKYLFPNYKPARSGAVRRDVLASVGEQVPAESENIELADTSQRAAEAGTAIKKYLQTLICIRFLALETD